MVQLTIIVNEVFITANYDLQLQVVIVVYTYTLKKHKYFTGIPSWFYQTQLCYQWRPDGNGGQCGGGVPWKLCASVGSKTQYYRDDTDRRSGGCRMQWGIFSPNAKS